MARRPDICVGAALYIYNYFCRSLWWELSSQLREVVKGSTGERVGAVIVCPSALDEAKQHTQSKE